MNAALPPQLSYNCESHLEGLRPLKPLVPAANYNKD